jgi:cytochrome bd-type quinol oxidase subunit 2
MNSISNLWGRNPAMILALVGAVIALGVSFGLSLTAEQTGAILAVVQIVLGLITRSQVTPNQDV